MATKKPPTREPVTFRLRADIVRQAEKIATREGLTRAEYVERAVTRAVAEDDRRAA